MTTKEHEIKLYSRSYAALKKDADKLRSALSDIVEKQNAMLERILFLKFGAAPGAIVRSHGKQYRVLKVSHFWGLDKADKPWLVGNPQLTNGKYGIAVRNLYSSWEVVTP